MTALAVSSRARSPLLPDVPTLTEATGLNDLELTAWNGLVAPAGTPPAIVAKLNAVLNEALADPDVKLAKAEERIRNRRRQYLYQLRSRRRRGMALRLIGIDEDALRRRDPYDPMYEEE